MGRRNGTGISLECKRVNDVGGATGACNLSSDFNCIVRILLTNTGKIKGAESETAMQIEKHAQLWVFWKHGGDG